jgi:hypothetical protein
MTTATTTAIAIEATHAEERTTTNRDTREDQHHSAQTDARPATGTANLPSATCGANTINWK